MLDTSKNEATQINAWLGKIFRDADGNGIPDILEGRLSPQELRTLLKEKGTHYTFNVNGQRFQSFDELPPEQQRNIETAITQLTKFSKQAGGIMKTLGLFRLIQWFAKRSRRPHYQRPQFNAPRPYRTEGASPAAKMLRWLLVAVAIAAAAVYFLL